MKLKYIAYSTLLLAAAVGTSSCEDFLSKNPDDRMTIDSPERIQMLLVSAYCNANYALMCELSGDNIIDNRADANGGYNLGEFERIDNEIFAWEPAVSSTDVDSPSFIWQGCYNAIAAANHALEMIAEYEAEGRGEEVAAAKGEALLVRAYHHFLLANLFCMPYRGPELSKSLQGIPYSTAPETSLSPLYDRGNLADTYDKIEADLLAGLPLLSDASYSQPKYHFNTTAANAFAARFYLFKRDYVKAEQYATAALATEGAPGVQQFTDYWTQSFTTFAQAPQYYYSVERRNIFMLLPTYSTFDRRIGYRYALNGDGAEATVLSEGPTWNSSLTGYICHPCYLSGLYTWGGQDYGSWPAYWYELFEYTDRAAGIGYVHMMRAEFTTEETVFTRAEARIYLGKIDEAVADLKAWDDSRQNNTSTITLPSLTRDRILSFYRDSDPGYGIVKELNIDKVCPSDQYSVTAENEPYLQCVLHFRRIHSVLDGSRWFDIKRYGLEVEHVSDDFGTDFLPWNDGRRAFQLPADVLSSGMERTFTEQKLEDIEKYRWPISALKADK